MSRRRRQDYNGCSVDVRGGLLRLRFRVREERGASQRSYSTGLPDTAENRAALARLAKLVGAALGAGRSREEIERVLRESLPHSPTPVVAPRPSFAPTGPTLRSYYEAWIAQQRPVCRKAQVRDYRGHLEKYVLAALGERLIAALRPTDIRGLQAELLSRGLSVKYVKNIINGSLRALIRDATDDGLVTHDVFPKRMRSPKWELPEADPFTAEERSRIIEWFRTHPFRQPDGQGGYVSRPYVPYHAFVHTLFWTGLRPSEATGLREGDLDDAQGWAQVRRSRYLGEEGDPKTRGARRTVELFPATVELLRVIRPLRVTPDIPVFRNTLGQPLDQQTFSRHWYACLRALNIRQRGVYAMKDTFVSSALAKGVTIRRLEQQTGEN